MIDRQSILLTILNKEVRPALGCTGPVAVAFAAAAAKDTVGGEPKKVRIVMDKDSYIKNVAVGIPGIDMRGIEIAASLGAIAGVSSAGLEVLKDVTPSDAAKAKAFLPNVDVKIQWDFDSVGLYIEAWVATDKGEGHVLVGKTHTNIIFRELNGELIEGQYEKSFDSVVDRSHDTILDYKISEIIDFAKQVPIEEISICREAIEMNKIIAEQGYKPGVGENFGNGILEIPWSSPIAKAKSYAAAASDARMQGLEYPTMSCATSGNVGITCSMPLISMGESLGKSEEEIMRALAASFLLCVQMKSLIGRLSMFCACALASSVGIAGGMVMLLGGGTKEVDGAIRNVVGSVFGILCDGAKHGCALKLSMSSGVAIESSYMAMNGHFVKGGDGFVCNTADETVRLVGRMAKEGTAGADQTMCRLLYERNKIDSAKLSQMLYV